MDKTLIIDGHNYLYSSYYGIPSAAKLPNGTQVNAYYGFLSLLRKAYNHIKPQSIIVIFDSETGIKEKVSKNKDYKQNRKYLDTGMFKQLPMIKQALEYMNVSYIEHPEYEADDVIGSVAKRESTNNKVYISSQDKDFFQLINKTISVVRTEKGERVEYDNRIFEEKYGFSSDRYLEYLSLLGDPSDNIRGVKGIGEKTAFKIISENKDILEDDNPLLLASIDKVRSNLEFLKINNSLPLEYVFKTYCERKVMMSSNEILKELGMYD
jgi:DNA polymerase-1